MLQQIRLPKDEDSRAGMYIPVLVVGSAQLGNIFAVQSRFYHHEAWL